MESRAHGAHEEHADRCVRNVCAKAKGHASPHLGPCMHRLLVLRLTTE